MLNRIAILIATTVFMAGCLEEADSGITIENLANGRTYVGFSDQTVPAGANTLPETLVINHNGNTSLQVFFNGNQIGDELDYSPTQATIAFTELADFVREGRNTLVINPLGFFGGGGIAPSINFQVDIQGPLVQPESVCIFGDANCAVSDGEVFIQLRAADVSDVISVSVNGVPAEGQGERWSVTVSNNPGDNLFVIRAEDENGFISENRYLKDGAEVVDMFRAKITNDTIQALAPLISEQIRDIALDEDNDPVGLIGRSFDTGSGLVTQVTLNRLSLARANFDGLFFRPPTGDNSGKVGIEMQMMPSVPFTANDGNVSGEANQVGVSVNVDARIFGIIPINGIALDLETVDVVGDVNIDFDNGQFDLAFDDNVDLIIGDARGSEDGNILSDLTAVIIPIIRPIILDIVESTLQTNLNEFRLGASFTADSGASFDLTTAASAVITGEGFMDMRYNGQLDIQDEADNLVRSLGSVYEENPLGDFLGEDSNLSVNISSNIINQGFNTLYSIGLTHITATSDGEIHFGPDAVDDSYGSDGTQRLELIPTGPGQILFRGTTTNQADLSYRNATMRLSAKRNGRFETVFLATVDIQAGVLLEARDSVMTITINQSPDLRVIRVEQQGPLIELGPIRINVGDDALIGAVQFGLDIIYPFLSNTELVVDIPDIETTTEDGQVIRSTVTTDAFDSRNGHLRFSMSLTPEVE